MNSRAKGKRGELEFANWLKDRGFTARRGQQYAGGTDSPDVICAELDGIHFEVKRTEAGNPYNWLDQATADAGNLYPVVAHRRNKRDWIAVLRMDDFLRLVGAGEDKQQW
jgi:Holliday junction resolvase